MNVTQQRMGIRPKDAKNVGCAVDARQQKLIVKSTWEKLGSMAVCEWDRRRAPGKLVCEQFSVSLYFCPRTFYVSFLVSSIHDSVKKMNIEQCDNRPDELWILHEYDLCPGVSGIEGTMMKKIELFSMFREQR